MIISSSYHIIAQKKSDLKLGRKSTYNMIFKDDCSQS